MDEIKSQLADLERELENIFLSLNIGSKIEQFEQLKKESTETDFWSDSAHAQEVMQQLSKLENYLTPFIELKRLLEEIKEFAELQDKELNKEIKQKLDRAEKDLEKLKKELRFSGEHDQEDAILTIQAGAGGTDAQDWADMLKRMYVKWMSDKFKVEITDESKASEAGIKSVSMIVSGNKAYGYLKGEHGVHRLVRLSPFNSAQSRETSFAMVEVIPKLAEPDKIEVNESDLKIDVYRAGGHGGQSVNTTDSAVRITHLPTNTVVAIQNERSQIQNKETAMTILKSKLAKLAEEQHMKEIDKLKGPNQEAAWGNQIRNYVLHPYNLVKDLRSGYETSDVQSVLDGNLDEIVEAYLQSDANISES